MSAVEHEIAEKDSTSTSDASTVGIAAAADFVDNDRYDDDNDVDTPRQGKKSSHLNLIFTKSFIQMWMATCEFCTFYR